MPETPPSPLPTSAQGPSHSPGPGWLAEHLQDRFDPVLLILSPPRCGSTALARSLWQHPLFRWYLHEPYDRVYHRGADWVAVEQAVSNPLDVAEVTGAGSLGATGMIVKEMTFQPGQLLPELMAAATLPLVFTIRDPRLAIASRMRQREKSGLNPRFPAVESGWLDLEAALAAIRYRNIPYCIVEITRLRARPELTLPTLCERLGLQYTAELLSWPGLSDVPLGHIDGKQRHWYERVLSSTGFEPPDEEIPELDAFPAEVGTRAHVIECMRIYQEIVTNPLLVG